MTDSNGPVCLFVIGFANSGKTTFTTNFCNYLEKTGKKCTTVNLDPAAFNFSSKTLYNIREHFKAEEVMASQKLGANGTVNACLLLFSQALTNKSSPIYKNIFNSNEEFDYILVDTPGQVEAFLWSSATGIILNVFNANFKLGVLNLIDINNIFCLEGNKLQTKSLVSCYLYSCSIFLRFDYMMFNVYSKTDCFQKGEDHDVFLREMKRILTTHENTRNMSHVDTMIQLTTENFFQAIKQFYVSSIKKFGFDQLFKELEKEKENMDIKNTNFIVEYAPDKPKEELHEDQENKDALSDLNKMMGFQA
eukprot:GAHX01001421.1.p1 GENE.GAHX01001421.1~~GAHX01001421.1.p1  ORF type:complete len:306 (+),score=59.43 GAHX01001421.1:45-962(+)